MEMTHAHKLRVLAARNKYFPQTRHSPRREEVTHRSSLLVYLGRQHSDGRCSVPRGLLCFVRLTCRSRVCLINVYVCPPLCISQFRGPTAPARLRASAGETTRSPCRSQPGSRHIPIPSIVASTTVEVYSFLNMLRRVHGTDGRVVCALWTNAEIGKNVTNAKPRWQHLFAVDGARLCSSVNACRTYTGVRLCGKRSSTTVAFHLRGCAPQNRSSVGYLWRAEITRKSF